MTGTTTADLGDTIPTLMEEAMFTRQFKAIMRGLCWPIRKGKGSDVNVPYFNEVTAARLVEGIDMATDQKMSDTNVKITPYELGLKIILSKTVVEDDNEDLIRAAGHMMGDAYEKQLDIDLLGDLDNGTTSLAASANALTMGHFAAARATLLGNLPSAGGPAPGPFAGVIHPYHELDLVDILTPIVAFPAATQAASTLMMQSASNPMMDDVLRNYSVGRLFNMPIISDGNIAFTASAAKGGVFSTGKGGSIIYVSAREPNMESEYDQSLRGWELVYVGRVGHGNYLNGWTVELFADATAPA